MKKKRLIYQFHVDYSDRSKNVFGESVKRNEIGEYWEYSKKTVERYAEKVSADYIFENPREEEYKPHAFNVETFDKYRAIKYLDTYDQVLYLDTDVLIQPKARNIFDTYEYKAHIVVFFNVADKAMYTDFTRFSTGRINSGVILFNRKRILDSPAFKPEVSTLDIDICSGNISSLGTKQENILHKYYKGKWYEYWEEKHSDEITYLKNKTASDENFLYRIIDIYGIPHFHLHRKWNFQIGRFSEAVDDIQFIHFVGREKKNMEEVYHELKTKSAREIIKTMYKLT